MKKRIILISLYLVCGIVTGQTINVKGKITTAKEQVKNAKVIFVDANDSTKQYETISDALGNYSIGLITSINDTETQLPTKFELAQNYPNPFSSETAITYKLNKQSDIHITIYDLLGREVKKYSLGEQTAGVHGIMWDGRNNFGEKVSTGIYFYRLQTGKENQVSKMVLARGNGIINNISLSCNFIPAAKLKKEINKISSMQRYTIKIKNMNNTEPRVAAMEMKNVELITDTTIDLKVNKLPIANAGEDGKSNVGHYFLLDASKSQLGDGSKLYYNWTADTTNPAEVNVIPLAQIPAGFKQEGKYKFSLTVTDRKAVSEPDEVVIEVGPRGESKFEDLAMELEVRFRMHEPAGELTNERLDTLKMLSSSASFGKVTSLKGIEYCHNLTELLFGVNSYTDITPLAGLIKLEYLALDQNYILSDISPLENLINLKELDLKKNNISDISALKKLTQMDKLNLIGNPIKDFSPLENMKDITELWIGQYGRNGVPASGLSVIERFTKLFTLWMTSCEISDISFVKTLTNLTYLRIGNNKLTNIKDVVNCKKLTDLYLDLNEITDLTGIEEVTSIHLLDLSYNKITNLEPLIRNSGLSQGDAVSLRGNPLDEISIKQYIPELQKRGVQVSY